MSNSGEFRENLLEQFHPLAGQVREYVDDTCDVPPGPGQTVQVSVGGGQFPKWSREGGEIFYERDTRASDLLPFGVLDIDALENYIFDGMEDVDAYYGSFESDARKRIKSAWNSSEFSNWGLCPTPG